MPTTTPRCLRSRHSGSLLFAHLVVVVKCRRRVLSPALRGGLRALWSPSASVVSTGGAPIPVVRCCIEQQGATTALSPD